MSSHRQRSEAFDLEAVREIDRAAAMVGEVRERLHLLGSLLFAVTGKRFETQEVYGLWEELLAHQRWMGEQLGEPVHLCTAIVDFLTRVKGLIDQPVLIEGTILKLLQESANRDFLTGLYTRRALVESMHKQIARAKRQSAPFSTIMFDLDNFKMVNDRHGHAFGDRVLQQVAHSITSLLRAQDMAGRFGGDEILCLLPDTPYFAAMATGERVRSALLAGTESSQLRVSASYGIATFPADGKTVEELICQVDSRLYQVKGTSVTEERRAVLRLPAPDRCGILHLKGNGRPDGERIPIDVQNISSEGMAFSIQHKLETGSHYVVDLFLKRPLESMRVNVRIVRVKETQASVFQVGCLLNPAQRNGNLRRVG